MVNASRSRSLFLPFVMLVSAKIPTNLLICLLIIIHTVGGKAIMMKRNKSSRALLVIFLGLTVGLSAYLSYTVYVYIGVALVFHGFDSNLTVDRVAVSTEATSPSVNLTMTVSNPFAGSYMDLYVAVKELTSSGMILFSRYSGDPVPGTFVDVYLPAQSSRQIMLSFAPDQTDYHGQDPRTPLNITLVIRILATTIINPESAQRIDVIKQYIEN
jgi:hypothetical protein